MFPILRPSLPDLTATDLLQQKDEEIRRMQSMLQDMSDKLRQVTTPSPASSEQSLASLPPMTNAQLYGTPRPYSTYESAVKRAASSSARPSTARYPPKYNSNSDNERDTILV